LTLPRRIENWSPTSLQQRLAKTGGRLVKHARYSWLMLAESHLTRRLFGSAVRRIDALTLGGVDTAKPGGPGIGAGEVFVEVTEKTRLFGFGAFQRGELGVWPGRKMRLCDKLSLIQEPKCKPWLNGAMTLWRTTLSARRKSPPKLQFGDQQVAERQNTRYGE
jgi:hypothetical protein